MKMIQFIVGTIVGGMIGVAMMCLMQINRLYRHDRGGGRMIRMEMIRTGKDAVENRLKKYQQILTGKGDGQHEQHGSSEGVRRGRDTAD